MKYLNKKKTFKKISKTKYIKLLNAAFVISLSRMVTVRDCVLLGSQGYVDNFGRHEAPGSETKTVILYCSQADMTRATWHQHL